MGSDVYTSKEAFDLSPECFATNVPYDSNNRWLAFKYTISNGEPNSDRMEFHAEDLDQIGNEGRIDIFMDERGLEWTP